MKEPAIQGYCPLTRFPVLSLFSSNSHSYETKNFVNGDCVIDGSSAPHSLWKLISHWKLSDEAQMTKIVENFFLSFLRANITPHVVFRVVKKDNIGTLEAYRRARLHERIENLMTSDWQKIAEMEARIIFGEVVKRLEIHHFLVNGGPRGIAFYAKSIDALVISQNNFFFFANLPRGYLQMSQLALGQLHHGLISISGETYFRKNFLDSVKCVEPDKMKSIALFATMVESYSSKYMEEFFAAGVLKSYKNFDLPSRDPSSLRLSRCLLFVTDKSFCDARLGIFAHMYPNERKRFEQLYESNRMHFESSTLVGYENCDALPRLDSYLEFDRRSCGNRDTGECSRKAASTPDPSKSVNNDEDDRRFLALDDNILPGWFKTAALSEAACGASLCMYQYLIILLSTGCFYPEQYLQNPDDFSACFASLITRRAVYGIMFQNYRRRLQEENNHEAVNAFRVEDAAKPRETVWLPSLLEMESLDVNERKEIFAAAMVGDSKWIEGLGPDAQNYEFNLLLLRSWAKRSPNLRKVHVIVLLLTILTIEKQYNKETRIFPWPTALREGADLRCTEGTATVRCQNLQPFAQLQSVTESASFLNFVLNAPYGLRVRSVREYYSELFFHNLLGDWMLLTTTAQEERLASLFDDDCREKFSNLVDALYGNDEEPQRAPLNLCSREDGFSPHEILGKAYYSPGDEN